MSDLDTSIIQSLDGTDTNLLPYIPYILQDLWEIGSSPGPIIQMIENHFENPENLKILDIGCGKGYISISLAKEFNCNCHGIDALPEFIKVAKEKADEYNVSQNCRFEIGDIREKVKSLFEYDVIILASIGPILGNYRSTLNTLKNSLNIGGMIIIDDGYAKEDIESDFGIAAKADLMKEIDEAGMEMADEIIEDPQFTYESDKYIFENISQRCRELIIKYPDKKKLLEDYIDKQAAENEILEKKMVCSAMALKSKKG